MNPDFVFERMMEYVVQNDFKTARASALSDMNKIDNNPLSNMLIMTARNNIELIKVMAGFAIMSEKIKQYYYEPEKAITNYS